MMIAVVVDADKPGVTGWVAVRSTRELVVRGMEDGHLKVLFDCDEPIWNLFAEGRQGLPENATRVKVEVIQVNGNSRIFVDLE